MRLGKTAVVHFAAQVGKSVAGFVATFAIARVLGADGLGIYALAVALLVWLSFPANAISVAIRKRISEDKDQTADLGAGVTLSAIVAVVMGGGILLARGPVEAYVGAPVAEAIAALAVARLGFGVVMRTLEGQKSVAQSGIIDTGERVGRTVAQVAFLLLGWSVAGLILGHTLSLLVASALGVVLFNIRPSIPSRRHFARILEYARYSWLGSVKARMFAWMDTIVLGFFVGSDLIGIYEVSWTLASTLGLVSISIRTTLFPELSELGIENDYKRVRHYLNEAMAFTGVFVIPGLFGALAIGPRILKIYRPEFQQGATVLVILVGARLIDAYGAQFVNALNGIDRPDLAFRINLVFVVSNFGLNFALVYFFGWYGAAVATALSSGIVLVLSYNALSETIGRPELPVREITYQIVAALAMFGVILLLRGHVPRNHYLTIALVAVGVLVYGAVLLGLSTRLRRKAVSLTPEGIA